MYSTVKRHNFSGMDGTAMAISFLKCRAVPSMLVAPSVKSVIIIMVLVIETGSINHHSLLVHQKF